VQSDIASLRTELLRNDAEARETLAQMTRALAAVNDSLRLLGARVVSVHGDVRGETRSIQQQLLAIQELVGQSQANLNRWRAELEQRNSQVAPPPVIPPAGTPPGTVPPTTGATGKDTTAVVPPPEQEIGPSKLYQEGIDNLRRNSYSTGRRLLQELLSKFPDSDHAPNARYYIGDSYMQEKNLDAADAAYAAVVATHPNAERAPTALYKRAQIAQMQGNIPRARQLAGEVKTRYPRSDEAVLVDDFLKNLK
jgi:tol-pal system protein YbgF